MMNITADWQKIDPEGWGAALECGAFYLDHKLSEFERANLQFGHKARAWLIVCTKPVLNKPMQEIDAGKFDHGWKFKWHVRFMPTGWNEQEFRGEAKSVEQAEAMAFNLATALYAAVHDIEEPSLDAGKVEALKGEVKVWRHNATMIRYCLKDIPQALEAVKHYLKVNAL